MRLLVPVAVLLMLPAASAAERPSSFAKAHDAMRAGCPALPGKQHALDPGKPLKPQKLGELPPSLRLEALEEGLSLQALHVGSYDDEGPLLAKLHGEIMPAEGYDFAGRHHEIYLGDPRRTPPEKLKTLLRQPVRQLR